MIFKYLLRYVLFFLCCFQANGQTKDVNRKRQSNTASHGFSKELSRYSIGFQTGLTQSFGELNEQDMKGMICFTLNRSFTKKISVSFNYSAGKLGGEKGNFFNSYFVNEYNAGEILAKWNLSEQFRQRERGPFDFSLYGGVGLMVFNANAFDLDTDKLVRFTNSQLSARNPLFLRWGKPKGPRGIKKTHEGILPVGISLDYALLDKWKVGMDYRFYFARTDKLDATSGQRLINPEEGDSYSDTPNDKFSFLSVSLTYQFGKPQRR